MTIVMSLTWIRVHPYKPTRRLSLKIEEAFFNLLHLWLCIRIAITKITSIITSLFIHRREDTNIRAETSSAELQVWRCRDMNTVCCPLSLQPAHSRLSKDNWKLFFSRTHFLSFSSISIVYRVLEAFSLNSTLIFTCNNNNNNAWSKARIRKMLIWWNICLFATGGKSF